jgi:hypothetical protein
VDCRRWRKGVDLVVCRRKGRRPRLRGERFRMRVRKDVWEKGGQRGVLHKVGVRSGQAGMIAAVVVVVGRFQVEGVVHIVVRGSPWEQRRDLTDSFQRNAIDITRTPTGGECPLARPSSPISWILAAPQLPAISLTFPSISLFLSSYPLSQLEVEAYDRSRCKKKVGGARSSSRDRESGRRPR